MSLEPIGLIIIMNRGDMKTTFTDYGWKTETVVRKYYHVRYIGRLMMLVDWVYTSERLFPNDQRRKKCGMCKVNFSELPINQSVNVVIFKKEHRNMIVCDDCACKIKNREQG